ncbi:MAG: VanZ family protein [Burkholderiales bacterium]|uniref:VanZ family protein n=1 Tax=Inhella sp. TaxID=1921806 RepID=UPI001AD04F90|nr:VanZ family protein [Burkholderiales bacterium]
MTRSRRRSGATWLALGYLLLVAYASLYPFSPWGWPERLTLTEAWQLDWPRYWSRFDVWANALGYVPLGSLVFVAAWRSGLRGWQAALMAVLLPCLLAYGLELAQRFVALRVPSLADWLLNSGGAVLGALLAALAARLGWLDRWGRWRERWFHPNSAGALALLAIWPLGLVFPLPAPLAQGQFLPPLLDTLNRWLLEAGWIEQAMRWAGPSSALEARLATGLGLLAPCLLLLAVVRPGWGRLPLLLSVAVVGLGMSALATALGFGPANAWAWLTAGTAQAIAGAMVVAALLALLPSRVSAVLSLPVLTGLMLLVTRMDTDPFVALNLQRWELGPRVQLYGLLQWLGWLWPLLALGWLMAGLARGERQRS